MTKKTKEMPQRGRRLGKDAWVLAAKKALKESGIEAVKVDRLARALGATRAAFYWHFTDRDELLDDLLSYWKKNSSRAYEEAIDQTSHNGEAELEYINTMWVEEKSYDPSFDGAMRDWARTSATVARAVRKMDQYRIDILHKIFQDLGYHNDEALVRSRVAYFHQIGYLALGLNETRETRRELAPIYFKVLMGR